MRTDFIKKDLENGFFALEQNTLNSVLEAVNNGLPKIDKTNIEVSNGNVVYQEIGNIAVVSITGGMYKKDMSATCMDVVSYPAILKAINKAENKKNVTTILFRVDTGGGHVDGADEVEEAIYKSKKKTITLYENMGASGGIWIFTASDEVYATETTMLGSIGVVATYKNKDGENNDIIEITSSNAPNKRCSLDEDCKNEIQTMIDGYEEIFFARVTKNTGFDNEKIKRVFNNGGMIFASEAQKEGFIKEVITFDTLLDKITTDKNTTTNGGFNMEYNKETFDALSAEHKTALDALQVNFNDAQNALTVSAEKIEKLEVLLKDTESKIEAKENILPEIMAFAYERGVDKETLIKMATSESVNDAKVAFIDGASSDGAFGAMNSSEDKQEKTDDTVKSRAKKLDVKFV